MSRKIEAIIWGAGGGVVMVTGLLALIYYPGYLLWEFFIGLTAVLILALLAMRHTWRQRWTNIFLGAVIVTGNFVFVLLLAGTPLRWVMVGVGGLMTGLWCWSVGRETIIGGLNRGLGLVALFFIAYGLDTIGNFFSLAQWQMIAGLFLISLMVSGPALTVLGRSATQVWLYSLVISLGLVELWWCLEFWPTTLMTNSLIVVALAYFLLSIASRALVGSLDAKKAWQYGLMSGLIVALALLTTPWFLAI